MSAHQTALPWESSLLLAVCGKSFPARHIVSGEIVRKEIATEILKTVPDWSA